MEILLYDFDAFTRHRGLGYVQLPLSSVPDIETNLITITKPILRYGAEGGFKAPPLGELMISVSYQPSIEKLTIIVVRARNLPVLDDATNANPYVKVYMQCYFFDRDFDKLNLSNLYMYIYLNYKILLKSSVRIKFLFFSFK